jgi:hypothetical protein
MLNPYFLPHAICCISISVHLPPMYVLVLILVLILVFVAVRFTEYNVQFSTSVVLYRTSPLLNSLHCDCPESLFSFNPIPHIPHTLPIYTPLPPPPPPILSYPSTRAPSTSAPALPSGQDAHAEKLARAFEGKLSHVERCVSFYLGQF